MKLLETLFAVAIAATLLLSIGAYAQARKPYALRSAVDSFRMLVADARAVARTSGSGATIVIAQDGGGFTATLYPYRPFGGADLTVPAVRTVRANVALTSTAVFVSSSGTTSATTWTPSRGTLETEPSCDDATQLTFSDGYAAETHAIPCAAAELQ